MSSIKFHLISSDYILLCMIAMFGYFSSNALFYQFCIYNFQIFIYTMLETVWKKKFHAYEDRIFYFF